MIKFVRIVALPIWAILMGLAIFTTETVADELGWTGKVREFVRAGPSAMFDANYEATIIALFWLLTGALMVSWGEWLWRKSRAAKKIEFKAHCKTAIERGWPFIEKLSGIESVQWSFGSHIKTGRLSEPNVSDNILRQVVIFDENIIDPHVMVLCSDKLIWRYTELSERFVVVEVDLGSAKTPTIEIVVRPLAWPKLGKVTQEQLVWYDSW